MKNVASVKIKLLSYAWTRSSVRLLFEANFKKKKTTEYANRKLLMETINSELLPANSIDKQPGIFLKALESRGQPHLR